MDNYFTFNGYRSTDFELFIEHYPDQPKPAKKISKESIPGRNGDLVLDDGGYENVTVKYQCYFRGNPERAAEIAEWLYSGGANYLRLEDTYNPGYFRKAIFSGPMDIANHFNCKGRVTLEFDCLPELWLTSGEEEIVIDVGAANSFAATIVNPTRFPSRPVIRLMGDNGTSLTVEGTGTFAAMTITDLDEYIDIDCEMENCYKGATLCNSNVIMATTEFPRLGPGENTITVVGQGLQTITQIVVIPRWWRL